MLIVGGPASVKLAREVARLINCGFVEVEAKKFPDGEAYVRLKRNVMGERVIIVQSTYPPQDFHLIQLFLLVDAVKRSKASEVSVVTPYLAYARQDKVFRPNEPVSIEVVLGILKGLGVQKVVTVDVHSPEAFNRVGIQHINLSAVDVLASYFTGLGLRGASAFAPDKKASRMAEQASKILGGSYGWFSKQRDRVTGEVSMMLEKGEVEGREIVIFDDIISSGGTVMMAARMLKKAGASRIYSACTHTLMDNKTYMKILDSGIEEVVSTDTIPTFTSKVSVAGLLAERLKSLCGK